MEVTRRAGRRRAALVVGLMTVLSVPMVLGVPHSSDAGAQTHPAFNFVGMAPTPSGNGYWLVASGGKVEAFGDAVKYGDLYGTPLSAPLVGMAATPDGLGYWLLGGDGGVFTFGDAPFYGSTGNIHLNKPVVAMAAAPDGKGYWFVATDGGVFNYGSAGFFGSTGSMHLNKPIVGMAPTKDGSGYWLVASDGGIFSFGDARFQGSEGGHQAQQAGRRHECRSPPPEGTGRWRRTVASSPSTPPSSVPPGPSSSMPASWP